MAGIVLKDIKKVYPGNVVAVHECIWRSKIRNL